MPSRTVIIIGAGVGGLAAAIDLARQGCAVTVFERADEPGGKMRAVEVAGRPIDAGPTVFTLRHVFDRLFEAAGTRLDDHLTLHPMHTLARHAWGDGQALDLFDDVEKSADAIGQFSGAADADGYRRFAARTKLMFDTLEKPFMLSPAPTALGLVRAAGLSGLSDMARINPFETMWRAIAGYFRDPRLRQLFGRYATYCGSSPFSAPATLMLIAHAERDGVWRVEGGMHAVARALLSVAENLGATIYLGASVREIIIGGGRAAGVTLADGQMLEADAVICNADAAGLAAGALGAAPSRAVRSVARADRSLSAVTWAMVADTSGFPLHHHTVFFSDDYAAEFAELAGNKLPVQPTTYVCAQDRNDDGGKSSDGPERLLILVNAPPNGDAGAPTPAEIERCVNAAFGLMSRAGLTVRPAADPVLTGPAQFEALFPRTGGALYGRAINGTMASFQRPGSQTRLPGLYLAGGGAHPGAGVPMAAISGRLAAASVMAQFGSTHRSAATAMRGGTSTA